MVNTGALSRVVERVRATVAGEIVLFDLRARAVERLRGDLSYPNPERVRARRYGAVDDPSVPARFECLAERPDGSVACPRGAVDVVRRSLAEEDLSPEFSDERCDGEPIALARKPPLRGYQEVGVLRLVRRTQGLWVLPCGSGKTVGGVGAIARVGRSAIVVAHTADLIDQWVAQVREHLGIDAGRVDADHDEFGAPVVVASVLSLAPRLERDPSLGRRFGLVVVDECHRGPATSYQRALRLLPARHRLGLTATPDREDGHGRLVDWSFGPRLLVKTVRELCAEGHLLMPRLVTVPTPFECDVGADDPRRFAKLDRALVADAGRNELIASVAAREALSGETVLVLSNRKPHCRKLGKLIAALGARVEVVLGTTRRAERAGAIARLRRGEISVVVATSLADEGLDVPRLSRVVLAFPDRSFGRNVQRAGRLARRWDGKDPALIDVVDPRVPALRQRALERRRAYRSIGMDATLPIPGVPTQD